MRDYGQLENVLNHVLHHELECYVSSTPLILTAKFLSLYDRRDVEPLAEIVFERLGCPALALAPPAPLVLMGHGRLNGIVLDCGHGACTTAAVVEGKTVPGTACTVPVGGVDITDGLRDSLMRRLAGGSGASASSSSTSSTSDNTDSSWAWGRAQVWETLKERFAKFAPKRGHTDALWSLRKSVVSRRYSYLTAMQGGSAGLRTLSPRHREGLLRYMLPFDKGMTLPEGVSPVSWVLPDGTPLIMSSEPADCTEVLWRAAADYDKIIQEDLEGEEGDLDSQAKGYRESAAGGEEGSGMIDQNARWRQMRRAQRLKMKNVSRRSECALAGPDGAAPRLLSVPLSDPTIPRKISSRTRQIQRAAQRRELRNSSASTSSSNGGGSNGVMDSRMNRLSKPAASDSQRPQYCRDLAGAFLETVQGVPEGQARRKCVASTMLAGGTCLHPGFAERAEYELGVCAGAEYRQDLHFWSTLKPLFASYQGAALLANSSFRDSATMVSKAEYDEKGAHIIFEHWAF